ncbi:hypothetical protein [Methylocystis sp.]|uniref:hypothetical protein n=1 Tax=Methylocystis sp. TaxID=1911079 RepID=UPI003DA4236C
MSIALEGSILQCANSNLLPWNDGDAVAFSDRDAAPGFFQDQFQYRLRLEPGEELESYLAAREQSLMASSTSATGLTVWCIAKAAERSELRRLILG